MREIVDLEYLRHVIARLDRLVVHPGVFPYCNLRKAAKKVWFADYYCVFDNAFFNFLKNICGLAEAGRFVYLTLDPDPIVAWADCPSWYGACEFDSTDDDSAFASFIKKDPDGTGVNTIGIIGDCVAIFPESDGWLVYGNRETGIVSFAVFDARLIELHRLMSSDFMSLNETSRFLSSCGLRHFEESIFKESWKSGTDLSL